MQIKNKLLLSIFVVLATLLLSTTSFAHGVDENTKQFIANHPGAAIFPFLYIGAKHMVTGYDHLLFLVGVIFFLYRPKDILTYVSFFTIGHSLTLLFGVLNSISINPYLIDAIIGFSIVYKGFDNLGGFKRIFNVQPNTKLAVLIFGLFHGFGLAAKLQEFDFPKDGLLPNLLAFNVGVEIGQIMALGIILILIGFWRHSQSFLKWSVATNTVLISAGFMLIIYQMTGYFTA
ncbi:MAG: HupE/UreJ family protein [Robiginitomaculum sp.]|nr:HupE/UreJ family protein [Robiginitomaculum sp.]